MIFPAIMASLISLWLGLLALAAGGECLQAHGTHWKGGAGVWHPVDEELPKVSVILDRSLFETLSVEPSQVSVGENITVSWTFTRPYSATPTVDIIAAYCPDTARDDDYVDYIDVPKSGKSVTFGPVVNMRCEYQFRYLRVEDKSYVAYARSPNVGFKEGTSQPTQGRLSETGVAGEMNVMWVSDLSSMSVVQYKLSSSSSSTAPMNATGVSHTYKASDMCNSPANLTSALKFRDPGFIHNVVITDLVPATGYTYRFGSDGHWSEWFNFTTQAAPGSSTPVDMFVYGDLGEWRSAAGPPPADRSYTTMWHINNDLNSGRKFDLLLHVGDISYARGVAYQWEQFGDLIQSVSTRIPYFLCIGNHEYDHVAGGERDPSRADGNGYHPSWGNYGSDSGGECAVPIVNRFKMPATASGSRAPFWYSHDYGMVHFLWLSTEHDYYPGSPMHDFIVSDLEAVNRTRTPWVFIMGHRPMYTSRTSTANLAIQVHQREAYEDVLQKYGVDVFFSGHYHSYERTCPVYKEECQEKDGMAQSTVHLMVGMAGASHDPPKYDNKTWSISRSTEYGYSRVHVANATHLFFEYVRNDSGKVGDSAWIVSDHQWHARASAQWAV